MNSIPIHIEQPAYLILYKHDAALFLNLTDPLHIARLLNKQNVIAEEVITSIDRKPSLSQKRKTLLKSVQDAVSTDYRNLLIFGSVLEKVNGNVSIAKDILNDYSKII